MERAAGTGRGGLPLGPGRCAARGFGNDRHVCVEVFLHGGDPAEGPRHDAAWKPSRPTTNRTPRQDRLGEAGAPWDLGGVRQPMGDYRGAADLLGQALERFRALGSRLGEANVLRDLGAVWRLRGTTVGGQPRTCSPKPVRPAGSSPSFRCSEGIS
ncbi:hypothetical protein GCM10009548_49240 [Streptomyces malaysiensis subsp. malaysiensis]